MGRLVQHDPAAFCLRQTLASTVRAQVHRNSSNSITTASNEPGAVQTVPWQRRDACRDSPDTRFRVCRFPELTVGNLRTLFVSPQDEHVASPSVSATLGR